MVGLTDVLARASTTPPRETNAADGAFNRARQAISMLAGLRRFDLIDALVVEIQKRQERNDG